jgi:mannose-6-phosphate isomerase-like protein (cupin superfamily)
MEKSKFDFSKFSIEGHSIKLEKPWGWEIHWASTPEYVGKLIHLEKGKKVSLQYHDNKNESHLLISGKVKYYADDNNGEYTSFDMEKGVGYTVVSFQRHRFEALEDSDIIEVSTPEKGTTYRLEDDYSRTDETEEIRKQPRRGWNP